MKNQVISIFLLLVSTFAVAQEEIKWSGSVKVWNASASIKGNGGALTVNAHASSAGNLSLTGKKGDFFGVVSTLLPTAYPVDYSSTVGGYVRREDYDLALGYSFMPSVAALVGYKNVTYKADNASAGTMTAPYIGLTGSKSMNDRSFLYGTVIYAPNLIDNMATADDKHTFLQYELGYGYAITGTTQLTFGYRSQEIAHRYRTTQKWYSDTISGVIFGVNHNF